MTTRQTKQLYTTHYLNDSGTIFVLRSANKRNIKLQINLDNITVVRSIKYFENYWFGVKAFFTYKGKLTHVWVDDNLEPLWDKL